jgi:Glu-tRNA(Gln) amidotransferase subunit E-like FAD-binding protein
MPDDGGSGAALARFHAAVGAGSDDAVVIVWADASDAATAARGAARAQDAIVGVPAETRQAKRRHHRLQSILPGADRMYPDTDTPPIPVADAVIERIQGVAAATPGARRAIPTGSRRGRAPLGGALDLFSGAGPGIGPATRLSLAKRLP